MFDVDQFILDCRAAVVEAQPTLALKEVLDRTISNGRQLTLALGEPETADIGVLYSGPDVTILKAVWAPAMHLQPHNHNMAALIGIYGGRENNTFWRRDPAGLARAGGRQLQEREVAVLGPDVIHSVENPCRAYTAALHVYIGDYLAAERSEWDPQTFDERPFNLDRSRQEFAAAEAAWRRQSALEGERALQS